MKKIILTFFTLFYLCSYAQLAEENFEGTWSPVPAVTGSATDWLVLDNGIGTNYTWAQQVHVANITPSYEETPDSHAAYLQRENVTNGLFAIDYLVTPEFVVPANAQLRFQSRLTIPNDNGGVYKIKILPSASLGSPGNITNYLDMFTWASELDLNPQQTTYTEKIVQIPAMYEGTTVRIAFVMQGDNMDRWLIDQARVVSLCQNPSGLTASNITLTSAQLNWTNNAFASNWEIEIIPDSGVPTGHGVQYAGVPPYTAIATATGSPLIQNQLQMDSEYRYYVRALCDDTGSSDWIGPFDFKTQGIGDSCQNPIEITSLPFSDTDNTANFANNYQGQAGVAGCDTGPNTFDFFNGNEVVYQYVSDFTGEIVIDLMNTGMYAQAALFVYNECSDIGISCLDAVNSGQPSGPVTISEFPVTAGEDYFIVITSTSGSEATTGYKLMIQKEGCNEPEVLPVSNIGTTSATFSWTNLSGAASWELQVQDVDTGLPPGNGEYTATVSNGFEVNDLTPASNYEYFVRANCGDGTFSAWAGPYNFSTLVCEPTNQCIYTFVMKDTYGYGWVGQNISVKQNGVVLAVLYGAPQGTFTTEVQIPICNNMPIEVFWNEGFSSYDYTAYIGLEILNPAQQIVYTMPTPPENFGFQGSVLYNSVADCDTILCIPPTGLAASNATMNTIDLSWNGPATGNWEYYIVESGEPVPTGTTTGTATTINPSLGVPLDAAATNYDVYLRMLCDDNTYTAWSGPVTFGSSICPAENKCDYVFTLGNIFGYGWNGGYMNIVQNDVIIGTIGPSFLYGDSQSVTVPLCDDIPFGIQWKSEGNATGGGGLFTLTVINGFGQTIYNMPANSQDLLGTVLYAGENDCNYPLCTPPVDLYATNITTTTADIGWEGIATGSWEYYIAEASQPAPGDSTSGILTTMNPTLNVPLTIATNYEYYVRVVCDNNPEGYSSWAGPFAFNTEMCEEQEKCLYTFEMLSLNGYGGTMGTSFTILQGGNKVTSISMDFAGSTTSEIVQVALCPDIDIEIYWNKPLDFTIDPAFVAMVGLNVYDPFYEHIYTKEFGQSEPGYPGTLLYSGVSSCTPPPCRKPLNANVTDITTTTATLHWEQPGDADQWTVWLLPYGSEVPVAGNGGIVVNENPYTIENLNPSSAYVLYVMAMCGEDGNSTVSLPYNFNTGIINDECIQAISIPVNPTTECVAFVTGVTTGATWSGPQEVPGISCGNPPGYPDTWYSFVAENTTHIIGDIALQNGYFLVYQGECNTLNQIYCNGSTSTGILRDLIIGETYYIRVRSTAPFTLCVTTPIAPVVTVTDVTNSQQLAEQMLLGPDCGIISNVNIVSGSNFGYENSIGYFNRNGTGFPMEEGMVLSTGPLDNVPGPFPGSHVHLTSAAWQGDADLDAILPNLTGLPSSNASILEFDFVPSTCQIGFDFLMASDIYGTSWLCTSNNGFAILLTGPMSENNPETINLATVPGTNTPISTLSVSSPEAIPYSDCEPQNTDYFGQMNWIDPLNAPTSFAGQTVVMQTSAQVLQGETYHMKIVIEDKDVHSIGCHDSALFIKGRACAEIVDLGLDLTEENGTGICFGENAMIDTGLNPQEYDFTWSKDGVKLEGETSATLTVTGEAPFGEGNYAVFANYEGSNCGKSGSLLVEFYEEIQFTVNELSICQGSSGIIAVTPTNFNAANATYVWTRGGETLPDTSATIDAEVSGLYGVTVTLNGCSETKNTTLTLLPLPVADAPANVEACGSYTLPSLSSDNHYFTGMGGTGTELDAGETVVTSQTLYVYAQSATVPSCTAENSFDVIITPSLQFTLGGPYVVCGDEEVNIAVSSANFNIESATYVWTVNGRASEETGSSIVATEFGTYTVTVIVGDCPSVTQSVAVQENTLAIGVEVEDFCDGNIFMLEAVSKDSSFNPDTVTYAWTGPNGFIATTRQFAVPAKGTYTIVVTTPEGCVGTAFADITSTSCFIQRGISPNGDGRNDSFDLENLDVSHLEIFNRYGVEVYQKNNYTTEWHGQGKNNEELPTGTYYYMIQRRNGEQITGWIYINREL